MAGFHERSHLSPAKKAIATKCVETDKLPGKHPGTQKALCLKIRYEISTLGITEIVQSLLYSKKERL